MPETSLVTICNGCSGCISISLTGLASRNLATVHSDLTASTQPIQTNVFMNIWTIQNSTGRIGPRSILYSVDM